MRSVDAVVIGAGPAGSVAAFGLARAGVRTLLVDREAFPRPKLCGGCLSDSGFGALCDLGLGELPVLRLAPRIERMDLRSSRDSLTMHIPTYRVIDRAEFDPALVEACVSSGAEFLDRTHASVNADGEVTLRSGSQEPRTIRPRIVLVADGLKGQSLRDHPAFAWSVGQKPRVGLGAIAERLPDGCSPDAISMLCAPHGYAGIAPLGDGRAVIAAAADPAWIASNRSGPALRALLAGLGLAIDPGLTFTANPGAPALTRRRTNVEAAGHTFVLGDAAGYVEPFTGEGMTWAIRSAAELLPHARAALDGRYTPGDWTKCHQRALFRRHLLCRASARLLRSEFGVRALMRVCNARPGAARLVTGLVRTLQRSPRVSIGAA